jgi:chain length determinant protein tyrosine kinase EpsG
MQVFEDSENGVVDFADNRIGQLLVDQGKIKEQDIERILKYSRKKQLRFGEAATKLRLITRLDLELAMATQFDYPYLEKGAGGYSRELVSAFSPFSQKGQAIRLLRAQLLLRWQPDVDKTLAVVGADAGEGSSYIAANLAVVFSQLGHRTLLVDADLQNGRQHRIFGAKNDLGLSSVLVGRVAYESVIAPLVLFRSLSLIPSGAAPPNLGELLGRKELPELVAKLRDQYDVIIIDTPPVSSNLGAEAIASSCGSALLVLRKDVTRLTNANTLLHRMHDVRGTEVRVVGSVMNKF